MKHKSLRTASKMLLLCTYIITIAPPVVNANSNMISITHRSSLNNNGSCGLNDYSCGLNVVKSSSSTTNNDYYSTTNDNYSTNNNDNGEEESDEYVTNFYRQKRTEKREEIAAKIVNGVGLPHSSCS